MAPPFGLNWGITRENLAARLQAAHAKVEERQMLAGREVWTVSGLAQAHLYRALFYFRDNGLNEAELQYQNREWSAADYNDLLGQLQMNLDGKFGTNRLIARSKGPLGDVTQTLTGYEWVQSGNAVHLIYFAAESTSQIFRMLSLHYKAL